MQEADKAHAKVSGVFPLEYSVILQYVLIFNNSVVIHWVN